MAYGSRRTVRGAWLREATVLDGRRRDGILVRIPLLTRVLNSLVTADLNRDLNTALRPELGRRLSAVLKLTLKAEFSPDVIARLEPGFRAEVWPVLIAVLKRRFRSVLNCDLRPDFTPEVTPLLITQVPV